MEIQDINTARVIQLWNSLSDSVIAANSMHSKNRLHKLWANENVEI